MAWKRQRSNSLCPQVAYRFRKKGRTRNGQIWIRTTQIQTGGIQSIGDMEFWGNVWTAIERQVAIWSAPLILKDMPMTGEELKALRRAKGLSRPELAFLCGLHPDSVKYWEYKTQVNTWGHAPALILKALGRKNIVEQNSRFSLRQTGEISDTLTRARHGVSHLVREIENELCGAKTRRGSPCRCKPVPSKRRCKLHGGLSTGPRQMHNHFNGSANK